MKTGKFGFFVHYYVNNDAYNDQDTAYFLRAAYGGTKDQGDWEVRYTYYYIEAEALFYAYVQSDATIGTNNESSRFDLSYKISQWGILNATMYLTDRIDGDYEPLTRFMINFTVKI